MRTCTWPVRILQCAVGEQLRMSYAKETNDLGTYAGIG